MRYLIKIILLFLPAFLSLTTCLGQDNDIKDRIWVGLNQEYIEILKDTVIIDDGHGPEVYSVRIKKDTLKICSLDILDDIERVNKYSAYFKIETLARDTLIIKPINLKYTKDYFNDTTSILFINKKLLVDSNLIFQGLKFTGSGCLGNCPEYKIDIDANGFLYVEVGISKWVKKGNYKSQLSKNDLSKLISILKRSNLDSFPENLWGAIDAPIYSFEFRYNNKIKKSNGSFIPYFNYELRHFLYNIPSENKLKRTKKRDVFEEVNWR